jgi:hypothetical protein
MRIKREREKKRHGERKREGERERQSLTMKTNTMNDKH